MVPTAPRLSLHQSTVLRLATEPVPTRAFGSSWLVTLLLGSLLLGSLLLGTGCSTAGAPTGSICPDDSTLTYANFGQEFMTSYCVRCHDSSRTGSARHGAPSDHDFDSLALIHETELEHIDETAAAGPDAINRIMPESGDEPTDAERVQLGEWLACGAP